MEFRKVHFIGIGGSGMNALAHLAISRGAEVSGSDRDPSHLTEALRKAGAFISIGHDAANVRPGVDLVVASAAIPMDNPELAAAKKQGVRIVKYAELLGMLMDEKTGMAVSGTHGKTTSTAMAAHVLIALNADPTVVIGAPLAAIGGSCRSGDGEFFLAEACEFDRSFLQLSPKWAIITNVEADHLDYFRDLDEIIEAFAEFASKVHPDGAIAVSSDCPSALAAVKDVKCRILTFGSRPDADFRFNNLEYAGGRTYFTVVKSGLELGKYSIAGPGAHNAANALGVTAILSAAGFRTGHTLKTLESYSGVQRRFEFIAEIDGKKIFDDYAHHPTEIRALLSAARASFPSDRICVIFQPHQYSRTKQFLDELAEELLDADRIIIPPIFAARDTEQAMGEVSSKDLVERIGSKGGHALSASSLEEAAALCTEDLRDGDVVITVGAGDIYRAAHMLKDRLESLSNKKGGAR